jgi:hypothetical protein
VVHSRVGDALLRPTACLIETGWFSAGPNEESLCRPVFVCCQNFANDVVTAAVSVSFVYEVSSCQAHPKATNPCSLHSCVEINSLKKNSVNFFWY